MIAMLERIQSVHPTICSEESKIKGSKEKESRKKSYKKAIQFEQISENEKPSKTSDKRTLTRHFNLDEFKMTFPIKE